MPLEIHLDDERPSVELKLYDHAAEGAFALPSGELAALGCTDELANAKRFNVSPGSYQLLYLVRGISTIRDETAPADEVYEAHIWPGPATESRLLKSWRNAAPNNRWRGP